MQISRKRLIGLVIGGVLVGATLSATAQEGSPAPKQDAQQGARQGEKAGRPRKVPGPGAAMRAEMVFPGVDGGPIRTVRTDRGVLRDVDGRVLVIREQDETTVRVPLGDDTKIGRDGEPAELSDLKAGDRVFTVRVREGDGEYRTAGVRAISEERWAEMQQREEQCRENPQRCRAEKRQRMAQRCAANPQACRAKLRRQGVGRGPAQEAPPAVEEDGRTPAERAGEALFL